jgi:hypothetical protein
MLVSTKDVANRLKISNRAVQNKCIKQGLVKIGNQYQITDEIAEQWYKEQEQKKRTEVDRTEVKQKTSDRTTKKHFADTSVLILIFSTLLFMILFLFISNLKEQIDYLQNENDKEKRESRKQAKEFENRMRDAQDVMQNQEIEIQVLKYKDSMQKFKFQD